MTSVQNNKNIQFYSFVTCPYAIRVRIMLEELQIPYDYKEIDLLTNQHMSENYLKINPMHKVPALILHNGEILYESLICCEFLDEQKSLYPKDRIQKARFEIAIKFYENNVTTKKWNMLRFYKRGNNEKCQQIFNDIQKDLQTLTEITGLKLRENSNINQQQKNYLGGYDFFSILDIAILPLLVQDQIIFKTLLNKDLLQVYSQNSNNNNNLQCSLQSLQKWINIGKQKKSFQKSTYQIEQLPPAQDSPLFKELFCNQDLKQNKPWDFEKFYTQFAIRKFLGGVKPKI